MTGYDVVVVGAGPAGLAAAAGAADAGCRVVVLDAGPRPGGQYWRHRSGTDGRGHQDWSTFTGLRARLRRIEYRADAAAWFVEGRTGPAGPRFTVHTRAGVVHGRRLVVATGAHDRVVPFPGWDLPGVVTAGGAQALLKGQGVVFARRVVVAGTGPFLLPVATGLAGAGGTVVGVYEANDPIGYARQVRHVLGAAGKLAEAGRYGWRMLRHRVPYHRRRMVIAAHGGDHLTGVTVAAVDSRGAVVPGSETEVECDGLAVGFGFTPQLELATALGCATRLDGDGSLVLVVGPDQATSVPGVYAAGEVTGVGGAELALVEGQLAGDAVAASLGRPSPWPTRRRNRLLRARRRLRRFTAALHAVHPVPPSWPDLCGDDTLVCRCEEVPIGAVRRAVRELSAGDARGAKLLTRAGMGWCQGRICGYATACLTAREAARPPGVTDLSGYASRPLAQPVTLGELAAGEPAGGAD
ncbi:Thioredoxin reductase [Micromonospora citrea]|uniref:Thioredoxin reductase n=1 Tax=Micromonospora citrea TaxID=47855 RepID=A0A1C6TRC1_9ACTN|nr:NAD(P)/FAD-dependent oxidoreductase [Micromonospora citrea]SCL44356.1 Thioredoxin reductase [Micromonospora citrea]